MNSLSNSVSAAMSPTRPMYWSVRRELRENRSIYIAPLVVVAVFLFGFPISIDPVAGRTPGKFLSTPGLWIGLIFAAAFFAAAVRATPLSGADLIRTHKEDGV